jgi:hypothetical protein
VGLVAALEWYQCNFFQFFFNVAQVAIMHKQYLAKFGNIQYMKVENLMHPFVL